MKPNSEIISKHDIMTCPVCAETISATVHADVTLGQPVLSEGGGKVDVPVDATLSRFHVAHHCRGRAMAADGDPEDMTKMPGGQ